jgi:hypothetical protein
MTCLADVMAPWTYRDDMILDDDEQGMWDRYHPDSDDFLSIHADNRGDGVWVIDLYPMPTDYQEANAEKWYCASKELAAQLVVDIMEVSGS